MSLEVLNLPPHSLEAEKCFLCCMLMDPDHLLKLDNTNITGESFYYTAHKVIFKAIQSTYENCVSAEMPLIVAKLQAAGYLDKVGGDSYICDLYNQVSTSANIAHYAEIIENKFICRQVIKQSTVAIEEAYKDTATGMDILDKQTSELMVTAERKETSHPDQFNKILLSTLEDIKTNSERDSDVSGVHTGYDLLDKMTAGWQRKSLIILAARPSMGKTGLAMNFAQHAAESGTPAAFFSLEMGKNELGLRLISMNSEVPLGKLKTGQLSDTEWYKLQEATIKTADLELYIDDTSSIMIMELKSKIKKLVKDKGVGIVFIDYIGLMGLDMNVERHEGISRISGALKGIAKDLDIVVVVLSQLNREVDKRPDKRPLLSDLRDSGSIEQDADMVIFLLRPEIYKLPDDNGNQQESRAIVIIGKHRSGPTGDIDLRFDKNSLRFVDDYYKFRNGQLDQ